MRSYHVHGAESPEGTRFLQFSTIWAAVHGAFTGRSTVGRRRLGSDASKARRLASSPPTAAPVPPGSQHPSRDVDSPSTTSTILPTSNSSAMVSPQPISSQIPTSHSSGRGGQQDTESSESGTSRSTQAFNTTGPEEQRLAVLIARSRRTQKRGTAASHRSRRCFRGVSNNKIRNKLLCFAISGILLVIFLSIYLALAFSQLESQEFHVIFILVILVTTLFFCHTLICLCVMAVRPQSQHREFSEMSEMTGPEGYANPQNPIRIALARDEEAAGLESEAVRFPPPAYGLWRESVRVDPNRIFWHRNDSTQPVDRSLTSEGEAESEVRRPPSYASGDGIEYIIGAVPRSFAPGTEVSPPIV